MLRYQSYEGEFKREGMLQPIMQVVDLQEQEYGNFHQAK
jgi:hypothetical protein